MELPVPGHALGRWLLGKMPSHGDFLSRGLDVAGRDTLDQWLSAEMTAARTRFADDFDQRYDAAPAWTFVHAGDDGGWTGGALCASQDRAGRRFPLMLAQQAADPVGAAELAGGCLTTLCQAFAGGWDVETLYSAPVAPEEAGWHPGASEWALLAQDGPAVILPGRFPEGAIACMMEYAP